MFLSVDYFLQSFSKIENHEKQVKESLKNEKSGPPGRKERMSPARLIYPHSSLVDKFRWSVHLEPILIMLPQESISYFP
jgi:hypothetical protein